MEALNTVLSACTKIVIVKLAWLDLIPASKILPKLHPKIKRSRHKKTRFDLQHSCE
jgi:hypothetical protein